MAEPSYYDVAETVIDRQWVELIWPIIRSADFSSVLELAPGRGRNTAKLLPLCQGIVVADINQSNIDFLRRKFKGDAEDYISADERGRSRWSCLRKHYIRLLLQFNGALGDGDVVRGRIS